MEAFNPLGSFNVDAPLSVPALSAARAIKAQFPYLPPGSVERIYGHWEVEAFGCVDGAYNGVVDKENGLWVLKMSTDFRNNMAGSPALADGTYAAHTWERNTAALGIAIAGMDGATSTDFGPDGVQMHELEFLCAFIGAIGAHYNVDLAGKVPGPGRTHPSSNNSGNHPGDVNTTGENIFEIHATCAMYDDYRDERWDLGSFVPLPAGVALTDAMRVACAAALRERSRRYKVAIL
jgi:hypothetical protein